MEPSWRDRHETGDSMHAVKEIVVGEHIAGSLVREEVPASRSSVKLVFGTFKMIFSSICSSAFVVPSEGTYGSQRPEQ